MYDANRVLRRLRLYASCYDWDWLWLFAYFCFITIALQSTTPWQNRRYRPYWCEHVTGFQTRILTDEVSHWNSFELLRILILLNFIINSSKFTTMQRATSTVSACQTFQLGDPCGSEISCLLQQTSPTYVQAPSILPSTSLFGVWKSLPTSSSGHKG